MTSDEELWRVFRLYLSGLSDAELETIAQQLAKESTARREHDAYPARLLFSSLTMADLEAAHDQI